MKKETAIKLVSILFAILLVVGIGFAISFGVYKLVFVSGAPKYVAVICGVATFIILGTFSNRKYGN